MSLDALIDPLLRDTYDSIACFVPELVLCGTIVLMLLVRLFRFGANLDPFLIAIVGAIVALWAALPSAGLAAMAATQPTELFDGMLVYNTVTVYIRVLLMFFAGLFMLLARMTGLADTEDGQDVYALVLGATLGMCIMASANHLMTVFLGVEMASVPSYVLAGAVKGRSRAGEASLKYAVYGAGAAGIMLYGISLLAGVLGTAHLPSIATALAELDWAATANSGKPMVLALAGLMIMVGLAFKLSAVPFHFWCPDVFEGASAEVDAFLSVASKAAALALLIRVALGVSAASSTDTMVHQPASGEIPAQFAVQQVDSATRQIPLASRDPVERGTVRAVALDVDQVQALAPVRGFVAKLLTVIAAITCTFGNLAAYGQTNIKRLFAYSTIAHAGYMMMPVAAAVQLTGSDAEAARQAVSALLFYAGVYLFMNLGAFSIVAFLRNSMGSEEIADYGGLIRTAPLIAICMTGILFSLIGMPPLGGFWAKVKAFMALVDAGGPLMITLLLVGGLNTVLSLIYYLRVAKTICIDPAPESRGPVGLSFLPSAYVLVVSAPVFVLGLFPQKLAGWAELAGQQLFR